MLNKITEVKEKFKNQETKVAKWVLLIYAFMAKPIKIVLFLAGDVVLFLHSFKNQSIFGDKYCHFYRSLITAYCTSCIVSNASTLSYQASINELTPAPALPHLSASESAGGFSRTLPLEIMTVRVGGGECLNLTLRRYLDHLREPVI